MPPVTAPLELPYTITADMVRRAAAGESTALAGAIQRNFEHIAGTGAFVQRGLAGLSAAAADTQDAVQHLDAVAGNAPDAALGDGVAPTFSPTPAVLGGVGVLFINWGAITNSSPVTYEVHLSTTNGFTAGPATWVAETLSTGFALRQDASGLALVQNTDYYVRLIAKDVDGAAPQSAQTGPTQVVKVQTIDIQDTAISLAKFGVGLRPIIIVTALPALPDTNYPDGTLVTLSTDLYKVYRNKSGTWTKEVDGIDLLANTVTTGSILAGAVTTDKLVVGDFDNLVGDPSFESQAAGWTLGTGWSALNDNTKAHTGNYSVSRIGNSALSEVVENAYHDVKVGDSAYAEVWVNQTGGTTGGVKLIIRWYDRAKATLSDSATALQRPGAYTVASVLGTAPANATYFRIVIAMDATTTNGTYYVDDLYVRRMVGTAIISDAAIVTAKIADLAVSTAKIADLAVNNAKVNDLSASKLTAGNIVATIDITSGLFRTAASGQRIEFDTTSFRQYDSAGNLVIELKPANGQGVFRTVRIEPKDATSLPLLIKDTLSTSGNWTEWQTSTGLLKTAVAQNGLIASTAGIQGRNALASGLSDYVTLSGTLDSGGKPGIYFGATSDQVTISRTALNELTFDRDGVGGSPIAAKFLGRVFATAGAEPAVVTPLTGPVAINVVANTLILQYLVPVNSVAVGTTFLVRVAGDITTTATSHTVTLQMYWGGIGGVALTPAVNIATVAVAGTRDFWFEFLLTVRSIGATGTIFGVAHGAELASVAGTITHRATTGTAVTIDTTAAKNLTLAAKWDSIATNANTISARLATIEIVKQ